jgi:hypothetical protein
MIVRTLHINRKLKKAEWITKPRSGPKYIRITGYPTGNVYETRYIKYKRFKNKKL